MQKKTSRRFKQMTVESKKRLLIYSKAGERSYSTFFFGCAMNYLYYGTLPKKDVGCATLLD
jgi:hypothetical protein